MRLPRSLHWRLAVICAILVMLMMGVGGALLIFVVASGSNEMERAMVTSAVAVLVGGLCALALAHFLTRRTSQTVQGVTDGARQLAGGDLDHRVRPTSHDQTRELAEAFNLMADTIRDMVRDLESEHNLLAVVMDTMADGVIVVDSENRITLINRSAQWLLVADAQATEGRPLAEVVRDPEVLQLAAASASTRQVQQAEIELLHHRRFLNVIATPITDEMGQGVLLTLQDVTGLKQMQTTRREFVSNVSHELRSPLASMMAMIETLEGGAIDDHEVAVDFLSRVKTDIRRMTTLVDELLELSRLESGHVPIHLAPVELSEVVEEIVEQFSVLASAKKVALRNCMTPELPYVMAEAGKLNQMLTNLVENALRFTPEGGNITLSANAMPRWVELTIADTGVGIAREHLPHVFERFYKADRSRRDEGTGLGLAIVKHLVQAHGGDISAKSAEGEGSTFTLTLRRAT